MNNIQNLQRLQHKVNLNPNQKGIPAASSQVNATSHFETETVPTLGENTTSMGDHEDAADILVSTDRITVEIPEPDIYEKFRCYHQTMYEYESTKRTATL